MTVSAFTIELDPAAAISGRTALNLNSGNLSVGQINWGESAIRAFLAEQQYGESPADYRIPNRQVEITMLVGAGATCTEAEEEEARQKLREKVGLLQREGGVLLRQRANGQPLYADIVNASVTIPDAYGETGAVEPNVILKLECLPDFYGEEIKLDAMTGTGQIDGVLQLSGSNAVIAGDYPARTRIEVLDKSGHDQRGLLWGLRSRYYSVVSTAALFYDAYAMKLINGTVAKTLAGTYSGKAAVLEEPVADTWHPILETEVEETPLTHVGSYRVIVRAEGETGQRLRFAWQVGPATAPTYNEPVTLPSGLMYLMDLGEVRLEEPPVGPFQWSGTVQVETGGTSRQIALDRIWLIPVDDGAGRVRATANPSQGLLEDSSRPGEAENNSGLQAGAAWSTPSALTEIGGRAKAHIEAKLTSEAVALKDFGLVVPSVATIRGIELTAEVAAERLITFTAHALKAGAAAGTAKSHVADSGLVTWGGEEDLWGTTWTAAQVNASNFGAFIFGKNEVNSSVFAFLENVHLTVYYTLFAGSIAHDAVIYANQQVDLTSMGAYRQGVSVVTFTRVSEETGDLPRLPPSGLEGRPCEILLKPSRGLLPAATPPAQEPDPAIDQLQALIYYRPCYLGRI